MRIFKNYFFIIYFTWSFLHIKIRFIKQRVYNETDDRDHIKVYHNIQRLEGEYVATCGVKDEGLKPYN